MKIRTDNSEDFVRYILVARSAYLKLRLKQEPEIRRIYEQAAADVARQIRLLSPGVGELTRAHLSALERSLMREAENIQRGLTDRLTADLQEAVALGARPHQLQLLSAIETAGLLLDKAKVQRAFADVNTAAVEAFWARTKKGLKLSDRIWDVSKKARDDMRNIIADSIARGRDAVEVARDLERYVQHGAASMARDYPGMMERIGKRVPKDLCYEAFRLARSEMTMAYMEGVYAAGRVNPAYKGVRWMLSSAHPMPDVCCRAGTTVQTPGGAKPIEEVELGDLVLTHMGRFRRVIRLYRRTIPAGSLIRLRYQVAQSCIHEVVLTPNHPVLTELGWIPASDLQTGYLGLCLLSEQHALPCQPQHDAQRGTPDTAATPDSICSSLHIGDCRNGARQSCLDGPVGMGAGQSLCRNTRTGTFLTPPSYIDHSVSCHISTWGVLISKEIFMTDGETVFNLGVDEDNSYMANGIAVHNCDDLASADLYGLGPGCYPAGDEPPYPHANCLCSVSPIVESTEEFAGRLKKWRDNPASEPDLEKWYGEFYMAR